MWTFGLILFSVNYITGVPTPEINQNSNQQNVIPQIRSNSFQLSNDPWLKPKEGVLATRDTKIFALVTDDDKNLQYNEIQNAVNYIVDHSDQLKAAKIFNKKKINPPGHRQRRNRYSKRKYSDRKRNPSGRSKVVYPELAIAVTYDFFKIFNFDYWMIVPYLLSFWNAVDMRYRGFEHPKYRFYIAQIIFETEPGNFKFLKTNENCPDCWTSKSIYEARGFWYAQNKSIPLNSYDLMIVMTNRMVCSKSDEENNICSPKIYGQAWPSGACSINHKRNETESVAIMYDNGAYEGISIAAHEIGHLLGANDDGISLYNYTTKDWGPEQCRLWDGYLMSSGKQASVNSFNWSNCTLERFEKFIKSDKAKCLYNKPKDYNRPVPRYLPGKLMTADEQCRRAGGIESCESEISNCVMLQCIFEGRGCENTTYPAVEGTWCGYNTIGHICIHGECVSESEIV